MFRGANPQHRAGGKEVEGEIWEVGAWKKIKAKAIILFLISTNEVYDPKRSRLAQSQLADWSCGSYSVVKREESAQGRDERMSPNAELESLLYIRKAALGNPEAPTSGSPLSFMGAMVGRGNKVLAPGVHYKEKWHSLL